MADLEYIDIKQSSLKKLATYFSIMLFVIDWLVLFIASKLDDQLNHGNFFNNMHVWRWGVLGLPLALLGIVVGGMGVIRAKGLRKVIPLIGLILCLITVCYLFWVIANTNNAKYWGA
jgi:hypothetical protein